MIGLVTMTCQPLMGDEKKEKLKSYGGSFGLRNYHLLVEHWNRHTFSATQPINIEENHGLLFARICQSSCNSRREKGGRLSQDGTREKKFKNRKEKKQKKNHADQDSFGQTKTKQSPNCLSGNKKKEKSKFSGQFKTSVGESLTKPQNR